MNILILTYRMAMGFGVDVVVAETARRFKKKGIGVIIGVIDCESEVYPDLDIRKLDQDRPVSKSVIVSANPDLIIVHTFPFFEQIAYLKEFAPVVFWEHGDPTPEIQDEASRMFLLNEKRHKREFGYSNASGIVAISEFISSEIGDFPNEIIYNGSNHVRENRSGKNVDCSKLKVGVLNRIGSGENQYKGNDLYLKLIQELKDSQDIEFYFSGRGKEEDAWSLRNAGINVKLNLTEQEKISYLQDLDVFISFSLWEGFNLPLVEAQRLGTLSLALDTGAHPEVTPFVFRNVEEMGNFLVRVSKNRNLLDSYSVQAKGFVIKKFDWDESSEQAIRFLRNIFVNEAKKQRLTFRKKIRILYYSFSYRIFRIKSMVRDSYFFIKKHGIKNFSVILKRKIIRVFGLNRYE